jgi:hypothetical protein
VICEGGGRVPAARRVPPVGRVLAKRVCGVGCLRLGLKTRCAGREISSLDRYLASSASRHRRPSSPRRSRSMFYYAVERRPEGSTFRM